MLKQTRDALSHPRAVLIGDAIGAASLFAGLVMGLHLAF